METFEKLKRSFSLSVKKRTKSMTQPAKIQNNESSDISKEGNNDKENKVNFRRTSSFRRMSTFISRSLSLKTESESYNKDSDKIKSSKLQFSVKYIGRCEVSAPRGTQICSQAAHDIKNDKSNVPSKIIMIITGEYCRLINLKNKELILDQIMEKISFCTPDPFDPYLFSFICRDGVSKKWICHCFSSLEHTGKRISNAFGCAFALCLEKKQSNLKQYDTLTSTPYKNLCNSSKNCVHTSPEKEAAPLKEEKLINQKIIDVVPSIINGGKEIYGFKYSVNESNSKHHPIDHAINNNYCSDMKDDKWVIKAFENLKIINNGQENANNFKINASELANNNPFKVDVCDPCLINPPPFSARRRSVMDY